MIRRLVCLGALLVGCGDNLPSPATKHCAPLTTLPEAISGDLLLGHSYQGLDALATGDLDGDGNADIAGISTGLELRLGNGDGTFGAPVSWPVGRGPYALGIADFDRDGRDDVLVYSAGDGIEASNLELLISNGDGTVHEGMSVSGAPLDRVALWVDDLNRDGIPDFVRDATAYLGNGDGTFQPLFLNLPGVDEVISTTDVNHDGIPDITEGAGDRCVTWNGGSIYGSDLQGFLGNGDGTFRPGVQSTASSCASAPALGKFMVVADVDGDGSPDAVGADRWYDGVEHDIVIIRRGLADGTFAQQPTWFDVGFRVQAIAVADFNSDGTQDLVVTSDFGTATVLLGSGGGNFHAPTDYVVSTTTILVSDFNKDGRPDILAGALLLGTGDGTFEGWRAYGGMPELGPAVLGDLDGNNFPDLVIGQQVFLDNRDGSFHPAAAPLGTHDGALSIGPFVGGSSNDLLALGNGFDVYPGHGDGTFATPQSTSVPVWGDTANTIEGMAFGDVNHDGLRDVVVSGYGLRSTQTGAPMTEYGGTLVLLDNGAGGFVMASGAAEAGVPGYPLVALGDLDGDGHLDLVTAGQEMTTAAYGDGHGAFTVTTALPVTNVKGLALADVDEDGRADVVVSTDNGLVLYRGSAARAFATPTEISATGPFTSIAIGDIDGDRHLDLVAAAGTGSGLEMFSGNGDGTFATPTDVPGIAVSSVSLADLNGDGALDIAIGGHAAGVLLGSCSQ